MIVLRTIKHSHLIKDGRDRDVPGRQVAQGYYCLKQADQKNITFVMYTESETIADVLLFHLNQHDNQHILLAAGDSNL